MDILLEFNKKVITRLNIIERRALLYKSNSDSEFAPRMDLQKFYSDLTRETIEMVLFLEKTEAGNLDAARKICWEQAQELIDTLVLKPSLLFLNVYIGIMNGKYKHIK